MVAKVIKKAKTRKEMRKKTNMMKKKVVKAMRL